MTALSTPSAGGDQHPREPRTGTVATAARRAFEDAAGDYEQAAGRLLAALRADADAWATLQGRIAREWALQQVRLAASAQRTAAFHAKTPDHASARLRLAISARLLDFPLPGGKRLADATADEVAEGAALYRSTASDALWKARWLEAVAERIGDATVGEALTEEALRALKEETHAN